MDLSYLERFLDKRLPDVIKALAVPFLCAVIMVPLTILVIGPLSDAAANGIAVAYNYLYHTVPAVAAILVGGSGRCSSSSASIGALRR